MLYVCSYKDLTILARVYDNVVDQHFMKGDALLRRVYVAFKVENGWVTDCITEEQEMIVVPPVLSNQKVVGISNFAFASIQPYSVGILSDGDNKVSLQENALSRVGQAHIYAHVRRSELPENAIACGKVLEDVYVVGSECS